MTTADYLESLQDDLDRTITALDLEEGTNFTDIADMAENGDISTGGGGADLDEYFTTEWNTDTTESNKINADPKKYPDIIIGNNVTSLNSAFRSLANVQLPRLVFGNNITSCQYLYYGCGNLTSIDMSMCDITNVASFSNAFKNIKISTFVPPETSGTANCTIEYLFDNFGGTTLDLSGFKINASTFDYAFRNNTNLTLLDIRDIKIGNGNRNARGMFYNCTKLEHLDIREFDLTLVGNTNSMFTNVPTNCEIIVKNTANKTWMNNNFSSYTNVKTVAEYEAE